jgi:hypothetical protein
MLHDPMRRCSASHFRPDAGIQLLGFVGDPMMHKY